MPPDTMQTINLLVTVAGFALMAARVGALLATISTKLDGVACDVARLEHVVQIHGEKIAAIEARTPHG